MTELEKPLRTLFFEATMLKEGETSNYSVGVAKEAIKSLFLELVGEDKSIRGTVSPEWNMIDAENRLKEHLRTKINEL